MENEQNIELEDVKIEEGSEEVDEKPKLTPDQIRGMKQRQFSKLARELGIELPKPKSEEIAERQIENKQNSGSEKLVRLAFLNSLGIPKEDHQFLLEESENTGKDLDVLVDYRYIKEELKNRLESRTTKEALPSNSKRSSSSAINNADYYFSKLERGDITLGQIPDVKIRREVRKMKERKSETVSGSAGIII